MGTLLYGHGDTKFLVDDRPLAHLQVVITTKLRRQESFVFSWNESRANGSGRVSIWLNPHSTLTFAFDGPFPSINRNWLRQLAEAANSPAGLFPLLEPEPADQSPL